MEDAQALRESYTKRAVARDKKLRKKGSVVLFEGRRLNGELIILRIMRRTKTSLGFMCYLPSISLWFNKEVTEDMVRGVVRLQLYATCAHCWLVGHRPVRG